MVFPLSSSPNLQLSALISAAGLSNQSFQDLTLRLGSCSPVWELTAHECTFRLSPQWPADGLQVGPSFLFYRRLVSTSGTVAERLSLTCPPDDWAALLAATTPTAGLAPCGTATVTTGQQLVEALEALQPGHARLLVTLAANISLPADPTPQRELNPPDDSQPLVRIYRNVTLAGAGKFELGAGPPTELDLRQRRGFFDVQGPLQERQEQQAQGGAGGALLPRPLLVMSDLYLTNSPLGPPGSWPMGLLSTLHFTVRMNRSGSAGVQALGLRCLQVYTLAEYSYMAYWYGKSLSLVPEDRRSVAWLQEFTAPYQYLRDEAGGQTDWGHVGDFVLVYNSSITPLPLLTPTTQNDYDLWSLEPPGSAASSSSSGGGGSSPSPQQQQSAPLPPGSFAVAVNASQLLRLLQEPWSGGPRVILVIANLTLRAGEWPQDGAALSYNVSLVGPMAGAPVWLDTGGLPLARAVSYPGNSSSTTTGASKQQQQQQPLLVVLQLQRLRLVGFSPPLLAAGRADVAAADAAGAFAVPAAAPELAEWRDSCLAAGLTALPNAAAAGSASPSPPPSLPSPSLLYDMRSCALELPEALALPLWLFNSKGACAAAPSSAADVAATTAAAAAVVCSLVDADRGGGTGGNAGGGGGGAAASRLLAVPLLALLDGMLRLGDLAPVGNATNTTSAPWSPPATILLPYATLGGGGGAVSVVLARSSLLVTRRSSVEGVGAEKSDGRSDGGGAVESLSPCRVIPLLAAIRPLLEREAASAPAQPPSPPPASVRTAEPPAATTTTTAAVIGAAVGGAALCAAVAVIVLLAVRRRRRRKLKGPCDGKPTKSSSAGGGDEEAAALSAAAPAALVGISMASGGGEGGESNDGRTVVGKGACSGRGGGSGGGGGGGGGGGDEVSEPAAAKGGPWQSGGFSLSFVGEGASSGVDRGTMADMMLLATHDNAGPGGGGAAGGGGRSAAYDPSGNAAVTAAAAIAAAALPRPPAWPDPRVATGPRAPPGPKGGTAAAAAVADAAAASAGFASSDGSGMHAHLALRAAMFGEIEAIRQRCQAAASTSGPNSSTGGGGGSQRMLLLGRGAYGSVYLGTWRGLPAAVKVLVFGAGEPARRHARIAHEAALTLALSHPNIVPTYHYDIETIGATGGATPVGAAAAPADYSAAASSVGGGRSPLTVAATTENQQQQQPVGAAGVNSKGGGEEEPDVAALRLRLVMQYCEGGTLSEALRNCRFGSGAAPVQSPPPSSPGVGSPAAAAVIAPRTTGPAAVVAAMAGAVADAGAVAGATAGVGAGALSCISGPAVACAPDAAATATAVGGMPRMEDGVAAAAAGPVGVLPATVEEVRAASASVDATKSKSSAKGRAGLSWKQLAPVENLPLALLAALDVLRGLEYLHSHNVIHGDLTDNNVLLKAVQPIIATAGAVQHVLATASAAAAAVEGGPQGKQQQQGEHEKQGRQQQQQGKHEEQGKQQQQGEHEEQGKQQQQGEHEEQGKQQQLLLQQQLTAQQSHQSQQPQQPRQPPQHMVPCAGSVEAVPMVMTGLGTRSDAHNSDETPAGSCDVNSLTDCPRPPSGPLLVNRAAHGSETQDRPPSGWPSGLPPACTSTGSGGSGNVVPTMLAGGGLRGFQPPLRLPTLQQPGGATAAKAAAAAALRSGAVLRSSQQPQPLLHLQQLMGRLSVDVGSNGGGGGGGGGGDGYDGGSNGGGGGGGGALGGWCMHTCSSDISLSSSLAPAEVAARLLRWSFKISDFGLSVQLQGASQTHLSNMAQGTPFFAAPEVVANGRLSPAADIYSFGVLLWLLLHGVSLSQLRPLLPFSPQVPIGPMLLRRCAAALPEAARALLRCCLELAPERRPAAGEVLRRIEALLRDVVGPEVTELVLRSERREHLAPLPC